MATIILAISLFPSSASQDTVQVSEVPFVLKKIAYCESKGHQFNSDGSIHRGILNDQDVGRYQINEHYHLKASRVIGMDIYTLYGNTEYALYLYRKNGTRDWNWSKPCWGKELPDDVWNYRLRSVGID